jgi:hypothetical protein
VGDKLYGPLATYEARELDGEIQIRVRASRTRENKETPL